jgi:single-stranded-DNA-specific exonuclease
MKKIIRRPTTVANFSNELPSFLQKIYGARGVTRSEDIDHDLSALLSYVDLLHIDRAVIRLVSALEKQERILIVGDFDADGATSSALAVSALKTFGAKDVDYLVPNRFEYGYGLTPEIVEVAKRLHPNLIITVDNGISSCQGVATAKRANIDVIITDHHLPGTELPEAAAIVNPNQRGDIFPSKHLAGVGVIFYVMLALRRRLIEQQWFVNKGIVEPNMSQFLDLVALGTVADVVPLDRNNRILVKQGLRRIQQGKSRPGIQALLQIAKRDSQHLNATDLAFAVAPRLNAAGRLDDMSLGIECLLSTEISSALTMAEALDDLNKERRAIEQSMQEQVLSELNKLDLGASSIPRGMCLYDETWHQGVIGILAGRIKEMVHRPVIAFAKVGENEVKGSARSVESIHIRDALDEIATRHPDLISKFGGHAMAAGLSLSLDKLPEFSKAFAHYMEEHLSPEQLQATILSDGEIPAHEFSLETAEVLRDAGPWGQGFPEPLFDGIFYCVTQKIVGTRHMKLVLQALDSEQQIDAIWFNADAEAFAEWADQPLHIAYRLSVNDYQQRRRLQLIIEHIQLSEIVGMIA